jgi:hypothetical protein
MKAMALVRLPQGGFLDATQIILSARSILCASTTRPCLGYRLCDHRHQPQSRSADLITGNKGEIGTLVRQLLIEQRPVGAVTDSDACRVF